MLGVWDYTFHPFGFNMFQRFHHPREDTENCQSSGSPKPQTLGSPLAGALGSDDSMLVQVAIYVWSKWTKKRPKKTEFQRECLKIIPADAKTVRLSDWPTSLVVFFTSPFSFSDSFSFQDLANTGSGHHWITESMELSWHPFQAQMIPDVGITAYSAYSPMIS